MVAHFGAPPRSYVYIRCRLNVLVLTEQVRRVVLVLHSDEPVVVHPERRLDASDPLVGFQEILIDAVASGGERHINV
jgi:hypothetical protein